MEFDREYLILEAEIIPASDLNALVSPANLGPIVHNLVQPILEVPRLEVVSEVHAEKPIVYTSNTQQTFLANLVKHTVGESKSGPKPVQNSQHGLNFSVTTKNPATTSKPLKLRDTNKKNSVKPKLKGYTSRQYNNTTIKPDNDLRHKSFKKNFISTTNPKIVDNPKKIQNPSKPQENVVQSVSRNIQALNKLTKKVASKSAVSLVKCEPGPNETVVRTSADEQNNLEICCICGEAGHTMNQCSYVPVVSYIPDTFVPSRARLSLPDSLELKKMADDTDCVYAKKIIHAGVEFGPFCAKREPTLNPLINFPLKIFSENESYLDTSKEDDFCNWMIFVTPASYVEDQNLICYQKGKEIYFATVKDINPGEPLKVWYAPFYASKMGIELLGFERLAKQHQQEIKLVDELVMKQKHVVSRKTWNCKFCYSLENSITAFAKHLLKHYQYQREQRCERCLRKFKAKLKFVNHLKYSSCSKNGDGEVETQKEDTLKLTKKNSTKNNSANKSSLNDNEKSKDAFVGGPLLHVSSEAEEFSASNLIEENSLSVNGLDVMGESFNLGNEHLTLSVDLLTNHVIEPSKGPNEEQFPCDICSKIFATYEKFVVHLTGHTGRYYCEECKKVFARREALSFHKCRREYNIICEICGKAFYQAKYLKHHIDVKHRNTFMCKKCNKQCFNRVDFQNHNCSAVPIQNKKKYTCNICNKYFFAERNLKRHMNIHTTDKKKSNIPCKTCGKLFSSADSYRRHVRLQHNEPQYVCHFCYRKFSRSDTVKEHIKGFHGVGNEVEKCQICKKVFGTKKKLSRHIKSVHSQDNREKKPRKIKDSSVAEAEGFLCPICRKRIKLKSSLHRHIRDFHSLDITVKSANSKLDKNKSDDVKPKRNYTSSKSDDSLKCGDMYKCPFCSAVTKLRNSLRRHIRNKHPDKSHNFVQNFQDNTDQINAELDKMIDDLDFTTGVVYTMDNLIESTDTVAESSKERTPTLNTSAYNISNDVSIIPVHFIKKPNQQDGYLSMPSLID